MNVAEIFLLLVTTVAALAHRNARRRVRDQQAKHDTVLQAERDNGERLMKDLREFYQFHLRDLSRWYRERYLRLHRETIRAEDRARESDEDAEHWWGRLQQAFNDFDRMVETYQWKRSLATEKAQRLERERDALAFRFALARKAHATTIQAFRDLLGVHKWLTDRYNVLESRFLRLLDERDMLARRNTEAATREWLQQERINGLEAVAASRHQRIQELEQELATERGLARDAEKYAVHLNSEVADAKANLADADETIQRLGFEIANLTDEAEQAHVDRELYRSRYEFALHKLSEVEGEQKLAEYEADFEISMLVDRVTDLSDRNDEIIRELEAAVHRGDEWRELAQSAQEHADDMHARLEMSEKQRQYTRAALDEVRTATLQAVPVSRVFELVAALDDTDLHALVNKVVQPQLLERPWFHQGRTITPAQAPHQTDAADL